MDGDTASVTPPDTQPTPPAATVPPPIEPEPKGQFKPKLPLQEVIRRIRALRVEKPGISDSELRARVGLSYGTVKKALAAIAAEEPAPPKVSTPPKEPTAPPAPAGEHIPGSAPTDPAPSRVPPGRPIPVEATPESRNAMESLDSAIRDLAPEVAAKVREAAAEAFQTSMKKSDVATALSTVDAEVRGSVAARAARSASWDLKTGEVVRRWWERMGVDTLFASPADFVETTASYWWNTRGRVSELENELEDLRLIAQGLARDLDRENRRERLRADVYAHVANLAMLGKAMPTRTVVLLLMDADSVGRGERLDYLAQLSQWAGPP